MYNMVLSRNDAIVYYALEKVSNPSSPIPATFSDNDRRQFDFLVQLYTDNPDIRTRVEQRLSIRMGNNRGGVNRED